MNKLQIVREPLEKMLEKSLDATRCPHCNTFNPAIRAQPAYQHGTGTVVIFSCMSCKRILGVSVAPIEWVVVDDPK